MSKKLIPNGKTICEACEGKGKAVYSCCTGEIVTDDIAICPECKEHLGEEQCESCSGTGFVDDLFDDYPDKAPSLQARAEMITNIKKYEL